jgi:hypothetical protein
MSFIVRFFLAEDMFVLPGLPRSLGLGLCTVWLLLLSGFGSSILTAWYYSWMHAPFWRPFGQMSHSVWLRPLLFGTFVSARFDAWYATKARRFLRLRPPVLRWQQCSPEFANDLGPLNLQIKDRHPRTVANRCRREDVICHNADKQRGDRMYHAYWPRKALVDTCLPLYDHWCSYIGVLVYLHSIKAYILTMTYLLAYTLYVFSVTAWAASRSEFANIKKYAVGIMVASCLLVVHLVFDNLQMQLHHLIFKNETWYERKHPGIYVMALPLPDRFIVREAPACPWDQGSWRKNWTHAMGPGWLAWIPFWQPQRVRDYDDTTKYGFEEKFGPNFEEWAESSENQRIIERNRSDGEIRAPPNTHRRRRFETSSSTADV